MRGTRDFLLRYWLPLFVGLSVAYVGYYIYGQLDRLDETINFSLLPLLASVAVQILFWLLSGHVWTVVLSLASGVRVRLMDGLFQLCLITLGKYVPGKIWGVVARASYAHQHHGIAIGRMVQATYVEQIYLIGAGVIVATLLAAALGVNDLLWYLAVIILMTIVVLTVYQKPLTALIRWAYRRKDPDAELELGDVRLPPLRMIVVLFLYMVGWLLLGLVMYGLYLSVFEADPTLRMAAIIIMACATGVCAGFVAIFAPGGVGVREAVSGGILAGYMPLADAVLLVLIFRLWLAALDVLVGGALYLRHSKG